MEQICALIAKLDLRYNDQLLGTMTVSAGIAASPEHALTAPDLLRAADAALYSAKTGRPGEDYAIRGDSRVIW